MLNFIPNAILGGTLVALTLGGSCVSLLVQIFSAGKRHVRLSVVLVFVAAGLIILSLVTRPYWGLAKLGATPAWLFLCSAYTTVAFLFVYWLTDILGKSHWFKFIKPAGTATLLCYLIPYLVYAFTPAVGISVPDVFLEGPLGLLKSFSFALLCVILTGALLRLGVKMKL